MKTLETFKKEQEALRERHWDPVLRWKSIQETITWAESQKTVLRNCPATCLRLQARKLKKT